MAINTAIGGTGTIVNTAYQYRLTSGAAYTNGNILNANWEAADNFSTNIGTGFNESGGVWTFPYTGIWHLFVQLAGYANANSQYYGLQVMMSSDGGSNYSVATSCYNWGQSGTNNHVTTFQDVIVDIPNTSNYVMKLRVDVNNTFNIFGSTNQHLTGFTAIRLGDT